MKYLLIAVALLGIAHYKIADRPRGNPYSSEDSSFDFSSVSTIGFISMYWTKAAEVTKVNELSEKQIYNYFKKELELKGYNVSYINKKYIKSVNKDGIEWNGMDTYPDIVLRVNFSQFRNSVYYPMQSYGEVNRGFGTEPLDDQKASLSRYDFFLNINCNLRTAQPEYSHKIWSGEITKRSKTPDLNDNAEMMIQKLLYEEFKHRSKNTLNN